MDIKTEDMDDAIASKKEREKGKREKFIIK
jgi:hypothetical protein